jgi:uncharacterized repeat protein (TIGR03806 family)
MSLHKGVVKKYFRSKLPIRYTLLVLLLACVLSCTDAVSRQQANSSMVDHGSLGQLPSLLSDWGMLAISDGQLIPIVGSVPYDLNTRLFTDYAHKFRTLWIPDGEAASFSDQGLIDFPVGTVITKTFYYPRDGERLLKVRDEALDFGSKGLKLSQIQLIETRVLVHREDGWQGLPYVWNSDQSEAMLEITGSSFELSLYDKDQPWDSTLSMQEALEFTYAVPDFNQCQGCHIENLTTEKMNPIGLKPRHINRGYTHLESVDNQITDLVERGLLAESVAFPLKRLPKNAMMLNEQASIDDRARSYLDINCGHCHNPNGAGDTSGLFLNISETDELKLGVCKPPIAAGQGTGGRFVGIEPGRPEASILSYRMESVDLGAMMPELGRSTVDHEGVELINRWITAMEGECGIEEVNLL